MQEIECWLLLFFTGNSDDGASAYSADQFDFSEREDRPAKVAGVDPRQSSTGVGQGKLWAPDILFQEWKGDERH